MDAFKLSLVSLAGWMNRGQQHVIEYLQEEIRILKQQQGDGRRNSRISRGGAFRPEPFSIGFPKLRTCRLRVVTGT
jgi:hypothetical protein